MITFPNAKINLGLNIIGKRPDGYHDLETVFYPVPIQDALEITPLKDSGGSKFRLNQYGMSIDGDAADNLVVKAYNLLDKDFALPPVGICLLKHIPSGAGLGGGSSDAACMLKLLNRLFSLKLTDLQLEEYATRLGADCAFFIRNRPTYAEGIGNRFSPLSLSLKGYGICIVKPDIFVSTREAFAHVTPQTPAKSLKEVAGLPVERWKDCMHNDFEDSVFPRHPLIGHIKQEMYRQGAIYAAMSGSGSAVYGIFTPESTLPEVDFGANAFVYQGTLE